MVLRYTNNGVQLKKEISRQFRNNQKTMKKTICILFLSFTSVMAFGTWLNTSHSNIHHGGNATYKPNGVLTLTFSQQQFDAADKKAFDSGFFITDTDILLTDAECKSLNAPTGTRIPKGKRKIESQNNDGIVIIDVRTK